MLLSIIIPTKNRQFTCLYAIRSALAIGYNDIEIVVQDCSDTDVLMEQIQKETGNDTRIKYFYTDRKPSMTENWNEAFSRATGEYLCAIGDDDAVLPNIYELAVVAKERELMAIVQKEQLTYTWPGFIPQPFNGTFVMNKKYSKAFYETRDLNKKVWSYSTLNNAMGYINFPQVYHCIFSSDLKRMLESETGVFLGATSIDVYSAIAFNKFVNLYLESDMPFTIRGASKQSNTQRLIQGKSQEHFEEFKKITYPDLLPAIPGLYVTAAESFIAACEATKQQELIDNIDLPLLYANIVIESGDYKRVKQKAKKFLKTNAERRRFYGLCFAAKMKKAQLVIKTAFYGFLKKHTSFVYKIYRKIKPIENTKIIVEAETILEACLLFKTSHQLPND